MGKSVICITCAVLFIIINTAVLFLKPQLTYAKNDKDNYTVYYQKWISSVVFMATIIMAIFCVFMAIRFYHEVAYILLGLECLLVVIFVLVKYKGLKVNDDEITVQRLFRKDYTLTFNEISQVAYVPNAKITVKVKKKDSFNITYNMENFFTFYQSLIKYNVKFKTSRVSSSENHVYLSLYNITINFPKTMYREFYQNKYYLKDSQYLFSAKSVEHHETIEGYYKKYDGSLNSFITLIENDLLQNGFIYESIDNANYDGFDFTLIKTKKDNNGRIAYIYKGQGNYFVIYADYIKEKEEEFIKKMAKSIVRSSYEDTKGKITKV